MPYRLRFLPDFLLTRLIPHMLDPQASQFLRTLESVAAPPFEVMGPVKARAAAAASSELIGPPLRVGSLCDRTVPGPLGPIPLRFYWPEGRGPYPILVYYHGGGWVLGDISTHDRLCTEIVQGAGCAVVSVDYRLAPEHKFPAAAEDAMAALQWVIRCGAQLGVDPQRVAVGGDSAGANLAAVACLMARDRQDQLPIHQVLIYPITDSDFDTPSYRENAEGYLLTRSTMRWFWQCYVRSEADMVHPYASPLRAESLAGLPPALVITAGFDPLRDEAEAYAGRLEEAGVPTTLTRYEGMIHAFIRRTDIFEQAHFAQRQVCRVLRQALRTGP
ncbi:MAG: alpha/beta hydrolase [Thermoguttaceae bacterium]